MDAKLNVGQLSRALQQSQQYCQIKGNIIYNKLTNLLNNDPIAHILQHNPANIRSTADHNLDMIIIAQKEQQLQQEKQVEQQMIKIYQEQHRQLVQQIQTISREFAALSQKNTALKQTKANLYMHYTTLEHKFMELQLELKNSQFYKMKPKGCSDVDNTGDNADNQFMEHMKLRIQINHRTIKQLTGNIEDIIKQEHYHKSLQTNKNSLQIRLGQLHESKQTLTAQITRNQQEVQAYLAEYEQDVEDVTISELQILLQKNKPLQDKFSILYNELFGIVQNEIANQDTTAIMGILSKQ